MASLDATCLWRNQVVAVIVGHNCLGADRLKGCQRPSNSWCLWICKLLSNNTVAVCIGEVFKQTLRLVTVRTNGGISDSPSLHWFVSIFEISGSSLRNFSILVLQQVYPVVSRLNKSKKIIMNSCQLHLIGKHLENEECCYWNTPTPGDLLFSCYYGTCNESVPSIVKVLEASLGNLLFHQQLLLGPGPREGEPEGVNWP